MTAPDKGELEYGSVLPDGEDWRLRRFGTGVGETEYRIFRNEKFFAMFDNREDADIIMGLVCHPTTSAEQVPVRLIEALEIIAKTESWIAMNTFIAELRKERERE